MTEDQLKKAAAMWVKGERIKEIAAAIGVTNNHMTWYASQHRDTFPSRGIGRNEGFSAAEIAARAAAKIAIPDKLPPKAPGFDGVTFADRPDKGCEFPLWGHREHFNLSTSLFCGAPQDGNSGCYCGFHGRLASGSGTRSERDATKVLAAA